MEAFLEIRAGGIPKDELLRRLTAAGVEFNAYAKTLFDHPAFASDRPVENFCLVRVKPLELGLSNPYSLEDAIEEASRRNLKPCPLYLAAFLRLEYLDQPAGPYLTIASLRPEADEQYPAGFYLRNNEGSPWLRGYRAMGKCDHPVENEFVFLK